MTVQTTGRQNPEGSAMPRVDLRASHTDLVTSLQRGALMYDTSVDTLRRRIRDGSLPAYRNGRLIRVKVSDLEALFRPVRSDVRAAG